MGQHGHSWVREPVRGVSSPPGGADKDEVGGSGWLGLALIYSYLPQKVSSNFHLHWQISCLLFCSGTNTGGTRPCAARQNQQEALSEIVSRSLQRAAGIRDPPTLSFY